MKEQFEFNSRLSVYKEEFVELRIYTHMYWSPINLFNRDIGCFRQKCETIFSTKNRTILFLHKTNLDVIELLAPVVELILEALLVQQ